MILCLLCIPILVGKVIVFNFFSFKFFVFKQLIYHGKLCP